MLQHSVRPASTRTSRSVLGGIVDSAESGFACGADVRQGLLQLRMNNVTPDGILNWSDRRRVPEDAGDLERYGLEPGDIMFNCTNSPDLVGKTALFTGFSEPVVYSNHFLRIRVNRNRAEPGYVSWWLLRQWQERSFQRLAICWVNQATVRKSDLLDLPIELPPHPVQRRIAGILDQADRLRRMRRYALELSDQFLPALFLRMFGDPASNPKGWPKKLLGKTMTIRRGASPRPIEAYLGGTVPWIKIGDSTEDSIYVERTAERVTEEGAAKSVRLKLGALIFANSGSVGFARILRLEGCIHDGWLAMESYEHDFNVLYLLGMLNHLTGSFLVYCFTEFGTKRALE